MKKAFSNFLYFLNLLVAISLIISYLSVVIPPDAWWLPSVFGMAFPIIAIVNLFFVVFWLFIQPRRMFLSLVIFFVGFNFHTRYFQFKGQKTGKQGVKVLSFNVRHFAGEGDGTQKENATKIVNFLNTQELDIICLQETRLRRNNIFDLPGTVRKLKSIEHYQYARSSNTFGLVTMTRFPIVFMGEIRFKDSRNMAIYSDIILAPDTVRVINVHLQSYQINPNKYAVIESPGIDQEKDLKEVKEIGSKFKKAVQMRASQVRQIRKIVDESPYPVIICGDFNDAPISYAYQKLRGKLRDAFVASGKGFGRTYVGEMPSFRIDNIFYDAKFTSYNFQVHDFRNSDHLPISCTLVRE
ncbi:MAG: hypothetical protein CSA36_04255 [Draconibacterium sp.]|nr:MAG: hypothetical protein CSA36_04255 [Draconibacterium sp.]